MVYRTKWVINDEGRQCSRCGEFKTWDKFNKNKHGTRGHQSWCSECFRIHEGRTKLKEYLITDEGRECSRCGEFKLWDSFHKRSEHSTGYQSACKKCIKKKSKQEKEQEKIRGWELQRKYGITLEQYYVMLDKQGGGCALCGSDSTSMRGNGVVCYLSVDHNHETGEIRGLLCQKCNSILGMANDDPEILRQAIIYLRNGGV